MGWIGYVWQIEQGCKQEGTKAGWAGDKAGEKADMWVIGGMAGGGERGRIPGAVTLILRNVAFTESRLEVDDTFDRSTPDPTLPDPLRVLWSPELKLPERVKLEPVPSNLLPAAVGKVAIIRINFPSVYLNTCPKSTFRCFKHLKEGGPNPPYRLKELWVKKSDESQV